MNLCGCLFGRCFHFFDLYQFIAYVFFVFVVVVLFLRNYFLLSVERENRLTCLLKLLCILSCHWPSTWRCSTLQSKEIASSQKSSGFDLKRFEHEACCSHMSGKATSSIPVQPNCCRLNFEIKTQFVFIVSPSD